MKVPHSSPYPDFLQINDLLTEAQKDVMLHTRDIVASHFMDTIADNYEKAEFDERIPQILGQAKLIGSNLDFDHSPHYDEISYGLIMRELERCDSALRSFVSVQGSLVMFPIHAFGSADQKKRWLPGLASGQLVGGFALTEPQGGSDPSTMLTTATKEQGSWVLNGTKKWVTNGGVADIILIWAKTDQGVRCFICPTDVPGLTREEIKGKLSLRASHSSQIIMDNVQLSEDALLPNAKGIGRALQCLNQARYGIIWGVLGAAEACFDETVAYCKARHLFKKSLSSFQMVQGKLADMCLKISNGQLLALRLGQLKSLGDLAPAQISLGKQGNASMALEVARSCREILGGNGILLEYCTMRHLCNLETVFTYEGTHDIHRLVVGQNITGTAAFS